MEYLFSVFWKKYRVGIVTKKENRFYFSYDEKGIDEAKQEKFDSIIGFPDIHKVYQSDTLFPFFKYRMSSSLRNQKEGFIEGDSIDILLQNEGKLVTDSYQLKKEKRN